MPHLKNITFLEPTSAVEKEFGVFALGAQLTAQPGLVGFSVTLGPDRSFTSTRPSTRVGNSVTLAGRLDEAGKLSGTYRVQDEANRCDSGEIPFVPTP